MPVQLRPHHFLCALCFQGKGYSPQFVANFHAIMQTLHDHEETIITVTDETDSICAPCPHKRGTQCESQEKIEKLDAAHREVLALKSHEQLTWLDAQTRIKNNLTLEQFHRICHDCEWKPYGICEQVLTDFLLKEPL